MEKASKRELHSLYRSTNVGRMIKSIRLSMTDYAARMLENRCTFKILTETPIGKIPLGRPRCGWEDNIRMDLNEIGVNTRK